MRLLTICSLILLNTFSFSQDTSFVFGSYDITISNGILTASSNSEGIVFTKSFSSPIIDILNLDTDDADELLIKDSVVKGGKNHYSLYVCKDVNGFNLTDSVISGLIEPYSISSENMEYVLITGNPNFDKYNNSSSEDVYSPINCWKYEGNQMVLINDEFYDIFINENEDIINYLDEYFDTNVKDCNTTKDVLPAIVSAYINYLNAEEHALALQIIENYYFCNDREQFKKQLDEINEE